MKGEEEGEDLLTIFNPVLEEGEEGGGEPRSAQEFVDMEGSIGFVLVLVLCGGEGVGEGEREVFIVWNFVVRSQVLFKIGT